MPRTRRHSEASFLSRENKREYATLAGQRSYQLMEDDGAVESPTMGDSFTVANGH